MTCPQLQAKLNILKSAQALLAQYDATDTTKAATAEMRAMTEEWEVVLDELQPLITELTGADRIRRWLQAEAVVIDGKKVSLESRLEGGSFEALISRQEKFYQSKYGPDFKIDRSKIKIEKSRLQRIKAGLENGSVNFPLITVIPDKLTEDEKAMTEAEFAFRKLLAPLKDKALKIWAETGTDRWSKLELAELLKRYIPVTVDDFDAKKLAENWQEEIARIIDVKKSAPKIQAGKVTCVFIDSCQDIPKEQKPINQDGLEVENKLSFVEMIKSKVNAVTPEQWITLAAQLYAKDKTYLSKNTWNWMMAVLKNGSGSSEPVSAAGANSGSSGVNLSSDVASGDLGHSRWRVAL